MHLLVDGKTLSIGHLGPDFLLLDAPIDHPPTTAHLFFAVDGNDRERPVFLPEGIAASSRRVVISAIG
jgi:hypothetical protein